LGDGLGDGLGGGGDGVFCTIDTSAQFQNSSGTAPGSPHFLRFPTSPGGRHEFPVTHHHHKTHLGHSKFSGSVKFMEYVPTGLPDRSQ
jgi:hypothetical protein